MACLWRPGTPAPMFDMAGNVITAHQPFITSFGGLDGLWYWYGSATVGEESGAGHGEIHLYTSRDLCDWYRRGP
eukprot:58405-Prymnesium_polylepis.1